MAIGKTPLLNEVYEASDLKAFYKRHNLDTTRGRIDYLAKTLEVSIRDSEKYISDSELLELLETYALGYPLWR